MRKRKRMLCFRKRRQRKKYVEIIMISTKVRKPPEEIEIILTV